MKSQKEAVSIIILAVILFSSFASAEIIIGETNQIYNIADPFSLSVRLLPARDTSDFFIASLICGEKEIELYKVPYELKAGTEQQILISATFSKFLISDSIGECFIKAKYGGEEISSQKFQLTNQIDLSINIEGLSFDPGNSIVITGEAAKANQAQLNGFVEILVEELNINFATQITEGTFTINFTLPDNVKAGLYTVNARAYEKDQLGNILNEGQDSTTLKVKQIIKGLTIAINEQSIFPRSELVYNPVIYDQAQDPVAANAEISIYRPDGSLLENKLVNTGQSYSLTIESNFPPGNWKIEGKSNGFTASTSFFVEELREISFSISETNKTLTVTNTGNIPYTGPVEISIGSVHEIRNIENLKVGESKSFKLSAPDGEYGIQVKYETDWKDLGTLALTGRAISIDDIASSTRGKLIFFSILIIALIIAALIVYLYRKNKNSRNLNKETNIISRSVTEKTKISPTTPMRESDIITKGERQESGVLALKINNPDVLAPSSSEAVKSLESTFWKIKETGAKIYSDGDYRIIIAAPILLKNKDSSITIMQIANLLERSLSGHNRRSSSKIDFGIGLHLGDLIVEGKDGRFRFASVDNTIGKAKKLAQTAKEQVLISETARSKTAGKIKTTRVEDRKSWQLDRVIDRSEHQDYVSRVVKRQQDEDRK